MAFVWLQVKPNDADGTIEILCGQSLQSLINRLRHQAESRERELSAKRLEQENMEAKKDGASKSEEDENRAFNITLATATIKSHKLNSDLGKTQTFTCLLTICRLLVYKLHSRQLKALELQPALTPEPLDMTSYCSYDYDVDHVCSINRSPLKSLRPNGFTTLAHADRCQIHRDLSSSALLPPGISTPPPSAQNRLLLGGRSFREVHYPGDMSLRFVKPLMNTSKSFTSSGLDSSEHYPQGHTTLPANRKAVLVSCGPKSPLGKRSKSVTFSQPVAMVTPMNSESEESMEKSMLSVEVDDPSYDNLNKLDIPDYPVIPGDSDLIHFSKWDHEVQEQNPIRSKSMSTFHNPNTSTPETKVFVTPSCDLRVNFDTEDLSYMSDSPSSFWSPPKHNGKPLVLPKPQKAELYETGV
ncbi:unnamed protein product [Candidula unifasciata]|uniref:Uncharacterized protein n=1 Tax=Candidula unifasciata TaxID=100452 RepID=A0A8S3YW68_9EUPU|nr:unnamed protein product [Candidula unifasciata]